MLCVCACVRVCVCVFVCVCHKIHAAADRRTHTQTHRHRQRHRDTETETERHTDSDTDSDTQTQRHSDTHVMHSVHTDKTYREQCVCERVCVRVCVRVRIYNRTNSHERKEIQEEWWFFYCYGGGEWEGERGSIGGRELVQGPGLNIAGLDRSAERVDTNKKNKKRGDRVSWVWVCQQSM